MTNVASGGNRLNQFVGLVLTSLISAPALSLLSMEFQRPAFAPANGWFWIALLCLVGLGFAVAIIGLRRQVHCGYFIWSQAIASILVSSVYIGWYRRELDYVKMGPDPDALDPGAPSATPSGFLILLVAWLAIGFAPLAIGWLARRIGTRRSSPRSDDAGAPGRSG